MTDAFIELNERVGDGGRRRTAVADGVEESCFHIDDRHVAEELLGVAVDESVERTIEIAAFEGHENEIVTQAVGPATFPGGQLSG